LNKLNKIEELGMLISKNQEDNPPLSDKVKKEDIEKVEIKSNNKGYVDVHTTSKNGSYNTRIVCLANFM